MKTLISAQTVRDAHAKGQTCLLADKTVLVTPEARSLAEQLGVRLEATPQSATTKIPAPSELDTIRAAVLSQLPADAAKNSELVSQIVQKVCAAQRALSTPAPTSAQAPASPMKSQAGGIKCVDGASVRLGVFPGAGADKQVGIADVITAADGAPIAAGFMAWSQSFFPWTLDYDEIDLVLEGELHIRCKGQTFVAKAGDVLYIPKGSEIEFGTPTAVRFFYVTYPANWQG